MRVTKNNHDYIFFIYLSIFWITIAWGLFLLALSGIFYWWSTALLIAIVTTGGARFILSNAFKISRNFLIINLVLMPITAVFIFFSSPTVFSGRDQGSISQAAIRLAENGKLEFSTPASIDFFNINITQKDRLKNCLIDNLDDFQNNNSLKSKFYNIYCQAKTSAKAFNFPGFFYTSQGNLITQFPIVYTAWLALFYSYLGILGFKIANGFLLYFSFLALYLVIYKLSNLQKFSLKEKFLTQVSTLTIMLTSFCFMWFSKFTLTENIATPILWTGILSLLLLAESRIKKLDSQKSIFFLLLVSLGLLIFTRIEGIIFFFLTILFLLININTKEYFRKNFTKIILPPIIIIGTIFIWNLNVDIYFYKSIAKATWENINENNIDIAKNNSLLTILNLFKIFGLYGLLLPIIIGLMGIFYLAKTKKYKSLIPLFIIFPSFFYILSPQITMEHPWMLRRFTFSILPIFLIYSIILISKAYSKKNILLGAFITLIIISFNYQAFNKYLTFIPEKNLLQETEEIGKNFSDQDLVLIDQLASGDNFAMIADPMSSIFGKNAVYFFNIEDLRKIDKTKYEKIYLIIPENKENYYKETYLKDKMIFIKEYSIKFDTLHLERKSFSLPAKEVKITKGKIFQIIL